MSQDQGYMIVLKPGRLLERFDQEMTARGKGVGLRKRRQAFAHLEPERYRGLGRDRLEPDVSLDQSIVDIIAKVDRVIPTNVAARRRYREILGENRDREDNDWELLESLEVAKEVMSLTDDPSEWDVIHVTRGPGNWSERTLGYDIGFWGGDLRSLIADVIVIPLYHPPPAQDFDEVADALSRLNDNLLFDSPRDAEEYCTYYRSKPWSEGEEPDYKFVVIRVNASEG